MTIFDKKGCPFELKSYESEDYSFLVEMYVNFTPKGGFQGLPPKEEAAIVEWLNGLIKQGENILAWQEGKVVGHVVIMPDYEVSNGEYLIFVSKKNRGHGVGKGLTIAAIQRAKDLGLNRIWLTVDAYNINATRLYKKVGFDFCDECHYSSERIMILKI